MGYNCTVAKVIDIPCTACHFEGLCVALHSSAAKRVAI